ncbi:MAG: class I SAM-dependent methyltransferase, partial [Rhodospirillaceae bacterium]|nr:class I SAM-dependent methyltransferase [Rhodospirillaceae bacterium]
MAAGESETPGAGPKTWFGFRAVAPDEKRRLVRGVFERVAGRYDLMNDLMSGGVHRLWKSTMLDWLAPRQGQRLLDVAGGTGDIAMRFLDRLGGPERAVAGGAGVVVCDLTPAMLAVGRDRAIDRGILAGIDWVAGDAQALPLADAAFDAYTIAFGLRNVADIDAA